MGREGIALAGTLIADIGYTIDVYPKKGNLAWLKDAVPHTGGLNNLVIDLARMDETLPLKVSGMIGEDDYGNLIRDTLKQYPNIQTDNITRWGRTAVTFAMTEEISKQRTFFYDPGTTLSYGEEHIDFDRLDARLFHLEYLLLLGRLDEPDETYGTRGARVLAEAKRRGMETSVDMVSEEGDRYREVVWPALQYTDYLVVNEVEGSGTSGIQMYDEEGILEEKVWEGLEKLASLGVGKWAVVHSPACGYGLDCRTGERVKVPSFSLPKGYIQGTTGAGDAFCAGVLYTAYKDGSLAEALYTGALCAAHSLSRPDSNSGVEPLSQMQERARKEWEA